MILTEKAREEANQLTAQVSELSNQGLLTPERIFGLQKRLKYVLKHLEQNGPNPRPGYVIMDGVILMRFSAERDSSKQFKSYTKEEFERYQNFFKNDPEFLEIEKFWPSTTVTNWKVTAARYIQRYILTLPLGMIICLILVARNQNSTGYALSYIISHPLRILIYPLAILKILWDGISGERESYKQNVQRIVSWLSYAIMTSVSLFCGGVASAQTKKESKKKVTGYTLQLDTRVIDPIEGPPSPLTLFNRTTLNSKRWLVESISTQIPEKRTWAHESGFGLKLVHNPRTTVSAMGIVAVDSSGKHKIVGGVQYFRFAPTYTIAVPVIRVEKTLNGPI
ncbi:hypothetical protein KW791_03580, partial [Candidatus Parcubacteria bacterium]|nr:hypothetical protein [Candidatus Parcubacteria bacterium]